MMPLSRTRSLLTNINGAANGSAPSSVVVGGGSSSSATPNNNDYLPSINSGAAAAVNAVPAGASSNAGEYGLPPLKTNAINKLGSINFNENGGNGQLVIDNLDTMSTR